MRMLLRTNFPQRRTPNQKDQVNKRCRGYGLTTSEDAFAKNIHTHWPQQSLTSYFWISYLNGVWKKSGVRMMTLLWLWLMVRGIMMRTCVLGLGADAKAAIEGTCRSSENCQHYLLSFGLRNEHAKYAGGFPAPEKLPEKPLRVGFATFNPQTTPKVGDIYACTNLSKALGDAFGWATTTIRKGRSWYEVNDIQLLPVAVDRHDLCKLTIYNPNTLAIAWSRNWFRC